MATIIVDILDDNGNVDGQVTLREAIQAANTNLSVDGSEAGDPGADIIDLSGLTGTITLGGTELTITEELTLMGPGDDDLTISANGMSRVINVTANVPLTVEGLTITGGITTGTDNGAGINSAGTVTLNNSTVSGNSSNVDGGGIFSNVSVTLTNSTVSGNSSSAGGGGIRTSGDVTLTRSNVSGNSANANAGIYSRGTVTLNDNSTVSGNSSATQVGGIFGERVVLNDSTVSNNSAGTIAGGIGAAFGSPSEVSLTNSTVSGNSSNGNGGGIAS